MNNFLILTNAYKDEELKLSHDITDYLNCKGCVTQNISDIYSDGYLMDMDRLLSNGVECVIVLGGDGTMLRAVHGIGEYNVPLVGINLGTLGFLTEIEANNVYAAVDRLVNDEFTIEKRMMIEGRVGDCVYHSLNDIVITRAGFSRIIGLNIFVNDQLLDTYEADGVIISTPTGSTGYNLSAGGPIISPGSKVMAVTPISPHSLSAKSVVFDKGDRIRIDIIKKRKTQKTEAIVSFDGFHNTELAADEFVSASASDREVNLIKMYDVNFYRVLRDKIGG